MDEFRLREIAGRGLRDAVECEEVAKWAIEYGKSAPDSRLSELGAALNEVADVWGDSGAGALSVASLDAINRALKEAVPAAFEADQDTGTAIARHFHEEVRTALVDWADERHR